MKTIAVTILLALPISFVYAQKREESLMLEKINLKSIESVFDEQAGKIDKETQALRLNFLEDFKTDSKEAHEIALAYLMEKQDLFGLNGRNLETVKFSKSMETPAGTCVYYEQYMNDIPVFSTNFTIFINKENEVKFALNEFRNLDKYREVIDKPLLTGKDALNIAYEYLNINGEIIGEPKTELFYFESLDKGLELAWKVNTRAMKPLGDWQIFVSAETGRIIHVEDIGMYATGSGRVFTPNPLVSANVPYNYQNNYFYAPYTPGSFNIYLESEKKTVALNDITLKNGLYYLEGPYCVVSDKEYPYRGIPKLSTPNFENFYSGQSDFWSVMCYYHIDLSARRILQLGYNIPDSLKCMEVDPHGMIAMYNSDLNYIVLEDSWYSAGNNNYVSGAEDADMIWHEYAHAIQRFLGSGITAEPKETYSIREGSSDYWAASYKRSLYPNHNWAPMGLWFAMNIPDRNPPRRVDRDWVYPSNQSQGHDQGQIWSSALMKIWGDLGRDVTDNLFLKTHFLWGKEPAMQESAFYFMLADLFLYNGSHLCQIYNRFVEHNLIDSNYVLKATSFVNQTVTTKKLVVSCSNLNVQTVNVTGSNAKLYLSAPHGDTTINGPFEVVLGSELEVK